VRASRLVAVVVFLGLVPGSILLAYRGHATGLYPYGAIPLVFGLLFAAGIVAAFALLSVARRFE